jgi:succinate dehydrogenase / fumarate reductase membrane anchor subunit
MNTYKSFKSDLSKARGLGSSGHGVTHWWHQRLSAIAIIPLVIWLIWFVACASHSSFAAELTNHPFNVVPSACILLSVFYHGALGMQVITEDYIHCLTMRYTLLIALKLFTFVTVVSGIAALVHFLFITM